MGETSPSGGDGELGGSYENGYDESEGETEHINSNTQPTLIRDRQSVSPGTEKSVLRTRQSDGSANKPVFDVHQVLALLSELISFAIRSDGS